MELTIKVNPTERTVRFREVHALAAGDAYSSVTLSGVTGAQTAALQLKLFKDSSASSVLAQCSSFAEVPGHPSERRGAMTLATQALKDWYESVANDATATDTNGMPSALVNAWLVISDSVKTWAACQVPLILRAMDTNVVQGADGVSPTVSLSKSGSVLTISITDVNGTHTETVSDGQDGAPGVSPTLLIDKNPSTGNTRITAVNADGSTSTQDVEVESVVSSACEGINLRTNATARDMLTCLQSILLRLGGSVSMLLLAALPCLAGPGEGTFGDLGMDDKVVTNAVQATASARAADAQAGTNYVDALRRDLTNGTVTVSGASHASSADDAATLGSRTYSDILSDMTNAATAVRDSTTFVESETDPSVYPWAKAPAKPSYTPQEVDAVAKTGGVYQATQFFHFRPRLSVGTWTASVPPFAMAGGGTGNAFVFGDNVQTKAPDTVTMGVGALNTNNYSFVWNGDASRVYLPTIPSSSNPYPSRYNGGFHVNPSVRPGMTTPLDNFWIGDSSLSAWIGLLAPAPGDYPTVSNRAMHAVQQVGDTVDVGSFGVVSWGPGSSDYKLAVGSNSLATGWLFRWQWGTICLPVMEGDDVVALLSDVPSWARAPSKPSYTPQEVGAVAVADSTNLVRSVVAADATNIVRRIVSVTSDYVWDAQAECLYRRSMENQYLYWTPVTNVNALLPENAHILEYLEAHKND